MSVCADEGRSEFVHASDANVLVVIVARDENASDNEAAADDDDDNDSADGDGARVSQRLRRHGSLHVAARAAVVREQVRHACDERNVIACAVVVGFD
jgi:hypothetical protein